MNPGHARNAASSFTRIVLASLLLFLLAYVFDLTLQINGLASLHGILGSNEKATNILRFQLNITLQELSQCELNSAFLISNKTHELNQMHTDLAYEHDELTKVKAIAQKIKEKASILAKTKEDMEKNKMKLSDAKKEAGKRKALHSILALRKKKKEKLNELGEDETMLRNAISSMNNFIDATYSSWPKEFSWNNHKALMGPPEDGYCQTKNLFSPIPYPWFCHHQNDVSLFDSNGVKQNLTYLGQLSQSNGEYVYHYEIENPGVYTIKSGDFEISKFAVNPEKCYCPESMESFRKKFQCSKEMDNDVYLHFGKWLKKSVDEKFYNKRVPFCNAYYDLIQISIINNTLYWRYTSNREGRKPSGYLTAFFRFMQSLLRKVTLPDCEFFVNEYAEPQSYGVLGPLVITANWDVRRNDAPAPGQDFLNWIETGEILKIATSAKPWNQKNATLFQRVFISGKLDESHIAQNEVIRLALEAKKRQNMSDVKIVVPSWVSLPNKTVEFLKKEGVVIFWWDCDRDKEGKYKFGVGHLPELGYPDLMLGILKGKLMLKRMHPLKRWWFDLVLKDGINYIEVDSYYRDLTDALDWVANNDDLARKMAQHAFHGVMQRARPQDAYCWVAMGLAEYSKSLKFTPKVRSNMKILDETPKQECNCVEEM